mgnify:CR=1 FL=1
MDGYTNREQNVSKKPEKKTLNRDSNHHHHHLMVIIIIVFHNINPFVIKKNMMIESE